MLVVVGGEAEAAEDGVERDSSERNTNPISFISNST